MTTLVTKGVFDVLHSNHKIFLSTLIEKSNCNSLLILLATDERAAFLKGKERPLFTYEWRQIDLYKFIAKSFPNIKLRFKSIKVEILFVLSYNPPFLLCLPLLTTHGLIFVLLIVSIQTKMR